MSNGPLKNCAQGICCPPGSPEQVAALEEWMRQQDEAALSSAAEEKEVGVYGRLALILTRENMIGMPLPHFSEWVHQAMGPTLGKG